MSTQFKFPAGLSFYWWSTWFLQRSGAVMAVPVAPSPTPMTKSGFGWKSCASDRQACMFCSFELNKHSVPDMCVTYDLNIRLCNLPAYNWGTKEQNTKRFSTILHKLFSHTSSSLIKLKMKRNSSTIPATSFIALSLICNLSRLLVVTTWLIIDQKRAISQLDKL